MIQHLIAHVNDLRMVPAGRGQLAAVVEEIRQDLRRLSAGTDNGCGERFVVCVLVLSQEGGLGQRVEAVPGGEPRMSPLAGGAGLDVVEGPLRDGGLAVLVGGQLASLGVIPLVGDGSEVGGAALVALGAPRVVGFDAVATDE
ncbi:hypothetical protein [Streptomyces sp. NPDC056549]|uniref:hypothetical protein n=1 Tax=Streptomyces sp. NPDC056549 TaxID=3345864 RepID=UPI0036B77B82